MASFVALNIEPEDDSEDEIDDSKEIQIEEALKLYQIALKLHSQGPDFYDEAEQAYKNLFDSEIFTYPESQRLEILNNVEILDDNNIEESPITETAVANRGSDTAPSTLPQVLYLSYKNHGQFLLDRLKHDLLQSRSQKLVENAEVIVDFDDVVSTASSSLGYFTEALNRDDTDLELWRLVSRVGEFLGSKRIARFCLEAVLDTSRNVLDTWMENLSLDQIFAAQQLKSLLEALQDYVSERSMPAALEKQTSLIKLLKKRLDLCSYLPTARDNSSEEAAKRGNHWLNSSTQEIRVPEKTWASCGGVILERINHYAQGEGPSQIGARYHLRLPINQNSRPDDVRAKPKKKGKPPLSGISTENTPQQLGILADGKQRFDKSPVEDSKHIGPGSFEPADKIEPILSKKSLNGRQVPNDHGGDKAAEQNPVTASGSEGHITDIVRTGGKPTSPTEAIKSTATISLPTRKRSLDSAGMQENQDSGRTKSKRIKARTLNEPSNGKEALAEDRAQYYETQLQPYIQADQNLFTAVESLSRSLAIESLGSLNSLREAFSTTYSQDPPLQENISKNPSETLIQDIKQLFFTWDYEKSVMFLSMKDDGFDGSVSGGSGPRNTGLTVFLEHSKRGSQIASQRPHLSDDYQLEEFAEEINQKWTYLDQLSLMWVEALLSPKPDRRNCVSLPSTYEAYVWSTPLKDTVVQTLVKQDEFIFLTLLGRINDLDPGLLKGTSQNQFNELLFSAEKDMHTVQNIFELHLDIYGRITNPSSEVDLDTRTLQLDRLSRWAALASDAINKRLDLESNADDVADELGIRFLWSTVLYTSLVDPASRDHIVLCFRDLKLVLEDSRCSAIELQNNSIMPEVTVEAAEREISRLTTRDFFLTLFNSERSQPIKVIESLEPILMRSICNMQKYISAENTGDGPLSEESLSRPFDPDTLDVPGQQMQQMLQFLDQASTSLKLFLWRRLGDSYEAIEYPPQVLSCTLRSIELVIEYLQSMAFTISAPKNRQMNLLRWLRTLDKLTAKAMKLIMPDPQIRLRVLSSEKIRPRIFDCVDEAHARSSVAALSKLQRILYAFMFCEDSVRIGQTPNPTPSISAASAAWNLVLLAFRNMLVRVWILQYTLFKDALTPITPDRDLSDTPPSDALLDYLKSAHQALGLRGYCNSADRIFPRFLKRELFLKKDPPCESIAQVIFDLHGLKICPNLADIEDHGCIPQLPDRETSIQILDTVMIEVSRMNMKDLGKSELRSTIEKMQQAMKMPKETTASHFNRRVITAYLQSPVNPMDLYRSLQGIGGLSGASVPKEESAVADKGWYFLLGQFALAKFRAARRTSPGPTEDLGHAAEFFKQDLELGLEKWETWYRLAQVFDASIEEHITWTADKLNNGREELNALQRSAIHCYTLAVAIATRTAEPSFETASKISDLYADFAMRIYSSSREPFSMEAFSLSKTKYFNGQKRGMYEDSPFKEMPLYSAWKFACTCLRRASVQKSHSWLNTYMLGKCLWKMHNCSEDVRGKARKVSHVDALDAFRRAIELLPRRRDSRHPEKQLTLEPHYKLLSTVHKLVQSRRLRPEVGCDYLNASSYAHNIPVARDLEDWEGYILHVLKVLRSADKANWHHRMVARAAHTLYDDSPNDMMAALGAKHELTQQIFTKTMQIQVWKPEHERPGRYFVYTGRYVSFFVRILYKLNDRASLEAVGKRYRKRPGDFFNHTKIWEEICIAYLKLLRRFGSVPEEHEDVVFKNVPPNVVRRKADQLEAWAQHSPQPSSPLLDTLREAIELKKLNGGLMKPNPIEDLIGDAYALLYQRIEPEQMTRSNGEENRPKLRVDHLIRTNPNNSNENSNENSEAPTPVLPPQDTDPNPGLIPITEITTARSRYRNVSRKEIQRNAEVLVAIKPPLSSAPGPAPRAVSSKDLTPAAIPEPEPSDPQLLAVRDDVREAGREGSSIPGSLHDSADDESELSDVGAEEQQPVMFPGLVRPSSRGRNNADEARSEVGDSEASEVDED